MKMIAVVRSYPTHLEGWLVNFIDGMERQDVDVQVVSMTPGENPYNDKIDTLNAKKPIWIVNHGAIPSILKTMRFGLKNLRKPETRAYIEYCSSLKLSFKEKIKALTLMPCISAFKEADIVHCHSERSAYLLLPLLSFVGAKFVITFHGLEPYGVRGLKKTRRGELYSRASHIIVNTRYAASYLVKELGLSTPYSIIPQGIDTEWFTFKDQSVPRDRPVRILTVGRLDFLKGYDYAIKSMKSLKDLGYDFTYTIVGAGLYKQKLEKDISLYGLSKHVQLVGPRVGVELLETYHNSDIFLLPSFTEPGLWFETQGIVLQEAQSCGLVVTASKSGGIPECVSPSDSGALFEPKDSNDLLNKLLELISTSHSWQEKRLQSRKWVETHYNVNKMTKEILKVYMSIIK